MDSCEANYSGASGAMEVPGVKNVSGPSSGTI
jgi:hypothetical protein